MAEQPGRQITEKMYTAWFKNNSFNVQNVVDDTSSDMGAFKTGQPGVAIHDQFADVAKV